NLASHFFDLVIGKILTSRLSLSKHLAHNLGNLLLLGKIGVFHNRRNASSRLLLLISKHLILCRSEERRVGKEGRPRRTPPNLKHKATKRVGHEVYYYEMRTHDPRVAS